MHGCILGPSFNKIFQRLSWGQSCHYSDESASKKIFRALGSGQRITTSMETVHHSWQFSPDAASFLSLLAPSGSSAQHVSVRYLFNFYAFSIIPLAEHSTIYQYNLVGAQNHYIGTAQTETVSLPLLWHALVWQITAPLALLSTFAFAADTVQYQ